MEAPSLHDFHHYPSGMIMDMVMTVRDSKHDLGDELWLKLGILHIHKVLTCRGKGKEKK
jgi:hypothetical protein